MNIYSDEKADEKAKVGLKLRTVHHEAITSLNFLKRKVKECCLNDWQKDWQNSKNKGKRYQQFCKGAKELRASHKGMIDSIKSYN